MTNEQIRIDIAESLGFCGGKLISYQDETICDKCENNSCHPKHNYPNYPVDLNAMHEVEQLLNNSNDADKYVRYLLKVCRNLTTRKDSFVVNTWTTFSLIIATPRQRAEAYLRMKGLWKD